MKRKVFSGKVRGKTMEISLIGEVGFTLKRVSGGHGDVEVPTFNVSGWRPNRPFALSVVANELPVETLVIQYTAGKFNRDLYVNPTTFVFQQTPVEIRTGYNIPNGEGEPLMTRDDDFLITVVAFEPIFELDELKRKNLIANRRSLETFQFCFVH